MRVCHFITNPYSFDTRVKKESATLRGMGCDVTVVGTRGRGLPPRSREDGVRVQRVDPKTYSAGELVRFIGVVGRDTLGGTFLWRPLEFIGRSITGTIRFGKDLVQQVQQIFRRVGSIIVRRFRGGPEADIDLSAALLDALSTESRMPLRAHAIWWLGLLLAILVLPLLPVFILLGMLIFAVVPVFRFARRTALKAARRVYRLAGRNASRVVGTFARVTRPGRNLMFRFNRNLALIDAGYRADPNVYQANDYDTILVTWIVSRLRGVPYVYDIHELYDESFPTRKPFRVRYFIRLLEGRLARRALHTITVGAEIARVMSERYRIPPPVLVRNAQPYEGAAVANDYLRTTIGDADRPERRTIFIYAGRVARGRGLPEAVAAMQSIDPDEGALIIMGSGDPSRIADLERQIVDLDLSDRVYVLPGIPSEDLPSALADADVGLMLTQPACLSYYYGLGNKLFHYVNAGIPVLVPDQPEKRQFIEEHRVGMMVEDLTPDGIAATMQRFIDDPERTEMFKSRCRQVAPTVAWEHEADRYESVYVDVYEHVLFDRPKTNVARRGKTLGLGSAQWSPA
ncbi:MAG: glycosyltransferase [Phycisphaerales bacterium]